MKMLQSTHGTKRKCHKSNKGEYSVVGGSLFIADPIVCHVAVNILFLFHTVGLCMIMVLPGHTLIC